MFCETLPNVRSRDLNFRRLHLKKKEIVLKGLQFYLLVLEIYTLQSSSQIETYRVDQELVSLKQEIPVCYDSQPH